MQGDQPEEVIEFSAQTTLPISFFLNGDLLDLVENKERCAMVTVKQTFYVRCLRKEVLILSANLTDWKPFLEFITGTASATLSIQDGQPSLVIGAEMNRR
ncbi:MAG: hypothetical protein H0X51_10245 [Parachlamydiaceae bacterium]|nr:hypothetical protein [Parachlamydiaceae bacterium]